MVAFQLDYHLPSSKCTKKLPAPPAVQRRACGRQDCIFHSTARWLITHLTQIVVLVNEKLFFQIDGLVSWLVAWSSLRNLFIAVTLTLVEYILRHISIVGGFVGWQVGWLVGGLVGWQIGWLIKWLDCWFLLRGQREGVGLDYSSSDCLLEGYGLLEVLMVLCLHSHSPLQGYGLVCLLERPIKTWRRSTRGERP